MADPTVGVNVSGGELHGVVGAGSVVIENLTFYSRAPEEPAQPAGTEPIGPCPYPGLAYFGPSDAHLFFGRDAAITRLAEAMGRQSFTALMGASGSGKSSVVLAGLAPRLHGEGAGNWRFSHFRIGTEIESKTESEIKPFRALARALLPFYVDSEDDTERLKNTNKLATNLKAGELTLGDVFAQSRSRNRGKRILLIADQFEEAFTLVADDAVRNRFIDVLLAGFPDPPAGRVPDICLILTMRADFYGRTLSHRPLSDALQNHVENLGPMNREELQAAIVRPAENAGVAFEPGMVETLLDSVQSKPGGLPLLEFALREMWGRQERKKITRKSYDEIKGVEGSLAQRAETVFAGLTKNGADTAMDKAFQRLFTRLVTLGEGQEDTRRVVERTELGDEVWGLAQRLAGEENRLVVTNASSARQTVEVVHEALIRHWPKLVDWINRDRAFQSWLRQIEAGIELWSANPDDEGPLLRGGMLAQALEWLARRRDDLSPKERAYIEASVALSSRLEAEKEAARQAEIKRQQELAEAAGRLADEQRRRARIALTLGGMAGVAAIIAFALTIYAGYESNRAEKAKEYAQNQAELAGKTRDAAVLAQSQYLADLSLQETERQNPVSGLLLAIEALPDKDSGDEVARTKTFWPPAEMSLELARRAIRERQLIPQTLSSQVVAITPDGDHIIESSNDVVRVRETASFKEVTSLSHGTPAFSAAVTADGARVITGAADGTARVWDLLTGSQLASIKAGDARLTSVALSLDGSRLVTAVMGSKEAQVWDIASQQQLTVLRGHTGNIGALTITPDGNHVVTAAWDRTVRLWNMASGQELLAVKDLPIDHAAWSEYGLVVTPDGQRAVVGGHDNGVHILDLKSGRELMVLKGHTSAVFGLALTPDGSRLVSGSDDGTARVWDMSAGRELMVLKGHTGPLTRVTRIWITKDGTRVFTRSWDTTTRVWDLAAKGSQPIFLKGHAGKVFSDVASPDGHLVVTASADKTARVWDAETGREVKVLTHTNGVTTAIFMPDGKRVVTGSADNVARVWNVETGQVVMTLEGHSGAVQSLAVSTDGNRIITGARDATARIWDANTGRQLSVLRGHTGDVAAVTLTPDGTRVLTGSRDTSIRMWDLASGRQLNVLVGHINAVRGLAVTADNRRLVSASADYRPRVWDLDTGRELQILWGHSSAVVGVAVTPDGKRVLTGSIDGTIRLWDLQRRAALADLRWHDAGLSSIALTPDGSRLITASDDGLARVWELFPDRGDIASAKTKAPRCLTPSERTSYHLPAAPPEWCARLQKWPYDRDGAPTVASFLFMEGKGDEADIIIAAASAVDPSLAKSLDSARSLSHNKKAWGELIAGRPAAGVVDAEQAVALTPDNASILDTRGQIYAALGRWAEAIADLDKAIAGGVLEASTFAARGRVHEASGNRDAAIADYRKALTRPANDNHNNRAHGIARERLAVLGAQIEPYAKQ
jgi:WD40 repeat protein